MHTIRVLTIVINSMAIVMLGAALDKEGFDTLLVSLLVFNMISLPIHTDILIRQGPGTTKVVSVSQTGGITTKDNK